MFANGLLNWTVGQITGPGSQTGLGSAKCVSGSVSGLGLVSPGFWFSWALNQKAAFDPED